jgi:hypothetical protein
MQNVSRYFKQFGAEGFPGPSFGLSDVGIEIKLLALKFFEYNASR